MSDTADIDPVYRSLGAKGRYQIWQMMIISIGGICAQNQLFDIIFIAKDVPFGCARPPINGTVTDDGITKDVSFATMTWNGSDVSYEQCQISHTTNVSNDVRVETHDCLFGYDYAWAKDASVVSEFGLVCDSLLLVSLSQTLLVLGQALGAFVASVISDRFGRKRVVIGSQLGLFIAGMAIGASPSYPLFAIFKFLIGTFQQGVVATISTMGIELFPREQRSLCVLIINVWWAVGGCSMALYAYLLRHLSWRVLQYTLSAVSLLVVLLQLLLVDESLRWLVANGRARAVVHVLKKAARCNGRDVNVLLATLRRCQSQHARETQAPVPSPAEAAMVTVQSTEASVNDNNNREQNLNLTATQKLTILDIFRHRLLLFNSIITYFAWFTVALVVFTLYLMSTSYAGDPYLNYFFTALMEFPPVILLYVGVDRLGRKYTVQSLFSLAMVGCIGSAVCRMFTDNTTLGTMSAVFAMVGMVGGSGAFGGLFFHTPEYFPTNLRNQALGISSTVGRLGGMVAPFMKNLSLLVIWAPGLITGVLCALVVVCFRFLPETKGRELPTEIRDIEAWYTDKKKSKRQKPGAGEGVV